VSLKTTTYQLCAASPLDTQGQLAYLKDRIALQDVVFAFAEAVDSLSDVSGVLACFTEDAMFDLTGVNLQRFQGHASMREYFDQVFRDYTHLAHSITNFRVIHLAGDQATCRTYVMGRAKSKSGDVGFSHVQYELSFVRSEGQWKIGSFAERMLMPMMSMSAETGTWTAGPPAN